MCELIGSGLGKESVEGTPHDFNKMNDGGYFQEFLQDRGAWWAEEFSSGFVKDCGVLNVTMDQV